MSKFKNQVALDRDVQLRIINAARDAKPVAGLTHNYYRYPARFSPQFVRTVIEAFTSPGETILDPFVGGGTTLVESMALNRNAIGIDISSLATFISEAKTLLLCDSELLAVRRWVSRLTSVVNVHNERPTQTRHEELGYFRNINSREYWRLRKCIELALTSITRLHSQNSQTIARCIVLRTAQWALDSRKQLPTVADFREGLSEYAYDAISGARDLREKVASHGTAAPSVKCFNRSAAGFHQTADGRILKRARLVLTSPPYPGVHVLYHRWQVDGRKETPAPFWIANKLDGAGASYYTLGDRKNPGLQSYFANLRQAFAATVALCGPEATIVQVVAFSEPEWQLKEYLRIMRAIGLSEMFLPLADSEDGRLWREVPNRRWYADQRGETSGSKEVVLFHRLSPMREALHNHRRNQLRSDQPVITRN